VSGSKCSPCSQCSKSKQCPTCADLLLSLCALGSHPPPHIRWILSPSYIRWILSTIYPLDPLHHHISVGQDPSLSAPRRKRERRQGERRTGAVHCTVLIHCTHTVLHTVLYTVLYCTVLYYTLYCTLYTVLILYSYCTHTVLYTVLHTVLILYSYCTAHYGRTGVWAVVSSRPALPSTASPPSG
jgi:hypothetical protein